MKLREVVTDVNQERPTKAKLLEVFESNTEDLCDSFIEYDTRYLVNHADRKYYELPKGKILILLFFSHDLGLWTTIRSGWRETKKEYYRSQRGEIFDVVIEEKEK